MAEHLPPVTQNATPIDTIHWYSPAHQYGQLIYFSRVLFDRCEGRLYTKEVSGKTR